jgi:hypothetical protein
MNKSIILKMITVTNYFSNTVHNTLYNEITRIKFQTYYMGEGVERTGKKIMSSFA